MLIFWLAFGQNRRQDGLDRASVQGNCFACAFGQRGSVVTWQCCVHVELNLGVPLPSSDVCGQCCGAPLGWSDSMCSTLAVESGDLSHWICHDQIAVPIRAETAKTANETGHVVIGGDERMVSPTILVPGGRVAPSRGTKRRKA